MAVRVTVFASSTPQTAPAYVEASAAFGRGIADAGCIAVFGGGNAGCMGAFYQAVLAAGGRVRGITHRMFVKPGGSSLSEENAAALESLEIVEGSDLAMRKRRLLDAGDCLVTLPGGVGTFDELFMAVAEVGVGCGSLPVLLLNVNGYYDGVIAQMQRAFDDGMLRHPVAHYYSVASTPQEAVAWCVKQTRRASPPTPRGRSYREGVVHGAATAAVAAAALVLCMRLFGSRS